jgi:hypothetical protein
VEVSSSPKADDDDMMSKGSDRCQAGQKWRRG